MKFAFTAAAAVAVLAAPVLAEPAHHGMSHGDKLTMNHVEGHETASSMSEGTVKKIDKSAGKLTIAHGPLENLGMPPMTMVFRVSDTALLDQVKAGDKIRFAADKVQGAFTVTDLELVE